MRRLAGPTRVLLSIALPVLIPVLSAIGCISGPEPPALPHVAAGIPLEFVLTLDQAMSAVQRVPAAKSHSIGVESPESLRQDAPDTATVDMIVDGQRMRMTFTRHAAQWDWTFGTSALWGQQPKSPRDVLAWLAAHPPR